MAPSGPFYDKLNESEVVSGVFFNRNFLSNDEAESLFETFNNNDNLPWDLKPTLYGQKLKQHVYKYDRKAKMKDKPGVSRLEQLCEQVEQAYDCKVNYVFCNRFFDPEHQIPWHKDTFAAQILVLSLGSERDVEFRENKDKDNVVAVKPKAGDIYFMPLKLNNTHQHRVCAANDEQQNTANGGGRPRISFVFFIDPPKYAKEYKITRMDKFWGVVETALT